MVPKAAAAFIEGLRNHLETIFPALGVMVFYRITQAVTLLSSSFFALI